MASAVRPRALVVDDDDAVRDSMALSSPSMGVDSSLAENGAAAIARVGQERDDFAIVDIGVPDDDDCILSEKLQMGASMMPIVIVTGHREDRIGAVSPFDHFIEKPIGTKQVRPMVESVIKNTLARIC